MLSLYQINGQEWPAKEWKEEEGKVHVHQYSYSDSLLDFVCKKRNPIRKLDS